MIYRLFLVAVLSASLAVSALAQDVTVQPTAGVGVPEPPCPFAGPGEKDLQRTFECINKTLVVLRDEHQALREENERLKALVAGLSGETSSIRGVLSWLQDQIAMVNGVAVEAKTIAVGLQPTTSTLVDDVWRLQQAWAQFDLPPSNFAGTVSTDPPNDGGGALAGCPAGSYLSAVQIFQFPVNSVEHEIRAHCTAFPDLSHRP